MQNNDAAISVLHEGILFLLDKHQVILLIKDLILIKLIFISIYFIIYFRLTLQLICQKYLQSLYQLIISFPMKISINTLESKFE